MPDIITVEDLDFNVGFVLDPVTVATPDTTPPETAVVASSGDGLSVVTPDAAAGDALTNSALSSATTTPADPVHTDPAAVDSASAAADTPPPAPTPDAIDASVVDGIDPSLLQFSLSDGWIV